MEEKKIEIHSIMTGQEHLIIFGSSPIRSDACNKYYVPEGLLPTYEEDPCKKQYEINEIIQARKEQSFVKGFGGFSPVLGVPANRQLVFELSPINPTTGETLEDPKIAKIIDENDQEDTSFTREKIEELNDKLYKMLGDEISHKRPQLWNKEGQNPTNSEIR